MTLLLRLAAPIAHAKKARSIPAGTGNRAGDAGKAAIGFAVPQKAAIDNRDVVAGALPFPDQNRSAARQQGHQNRGLRGSIAAQSLVKQTIQLSGDRFTEATLAALLPRIGNGERENVPTERSRRMLAELLGPKRPQFATGQPIEVMNIGRGVAGAIVYPAMFRWRLRR